MAVIVGERAVSAIGRHGLAPNQKIRLGIEGLGRADGVVVELRQDRIVLSFGKPTGLPEQEVVNLIVGICRPQSVRKVLRLAAELGVRHLDFVRCERSEKSYLDSIALQPGEIHSQLVLGLEQSWRVTLPSVQIHARFLPFIQDCLPNRSASVPGLRVLGCSDGGNWSALPKVAPGSELTFAVGPELGWNEFEVGQFKQSGFLTLSLGSGILRIEHACAFGLGQLTAAFAARST